MAWAEACWVELEFGVFADWVEVVEVVAFVGGVLFGGVVDGHSAEPADCMLCLALVEECCFVFFELACGLADSWHVVTVLVSVLTVGLSKLDMNNGPTIFWLNHSTNIR